MWTARRLPTIRRTVGFDPNTLSPLLVGPLKIDDKIFCRNVTTTVRRAPVMVRVSPLEPQSAQALPAAWRASLLVSSCLSVGLRVAGRNTSRAHIADKPKLKRAFSGS